MSELVGKNIGKNVHSGKFTYKSPMPELLMTKNLLRFVFSIIGLRYCVQKGGNEKKNYTYERRGKETTTIIMYFMALSRYF